MDSNEIVVVGDKLKQYDKIVKKIVFQNHIRVNDDNNTRNLNKMLLCNKNKMHSYCVHITVFKYMCFSSVLREEWIRGKYERLEFQDPEKQDYLRGNKEGFLMKLGKDTTTKFNRRRFILSETEGTLKYYNKEDVSFFVCFIISDIW